MNMALIVVEGIEVFNGPIPQGYEFVKVYDFKQGATGVGYIYGGKVPNRCVGVPDEEVAERNAGADSVSDGLRNETIKMALEQAVERVLEENKKFGLDITAVAEPMVYHSQPKVRKIKKAEGLQGALTIWLNVAGYRKKETQTKSDLEPITPQDIRKVMETYAESFVESGVDYGDELRDWFKKTQPEIYNAWLEEIGEDEVDGDEFFMEFSGNTLNGRVLDKFDQYLADFCNQNPVANKHIHGLLKECE
jgi:hypothetical protein